MSRQPGAGQFISYRIRSEYRGQSRTELRGGAGAMRDPVFHLTRKLRHGAVVAIGDEHRVVAEPVRAGRSAGDPPGAHAFEGFDAAIGPGQRNDAHEARAPIRRGTQPLEQAAVALFVDDSVAEKAFRANAR